MPHIDQYTYDDTPIGKGGMGCVYKARNSKGETIALKMLSAEYASQPAFRTFFDSEARALQDMDHPSVVHIKGATFSDRQGNLYLPMEFVEGITLEKLVMSNTSAGKFMTEGEAVSIMTKILTAFGYIHACGKIHRDIKPSNIMIRPDGSVCVIDFGIAKDLRLPTGYTIGHVVGTDGYMSPEQVNGLNIDHRTDIYSLGCLLYFMVTGQHAIVKETNDFATKCAILQNDFPHPSRIRPDLSAHIERAILRATDKNMLKRFADVDMFSRALSETDTVIQPGFVTVGRLTENNVTVDSDYVSRTHLEIVYRESRKGPVIAVTDRSRNGTAVNGKFVRHSTEEIPFDLFRGDISTLPDVLMAGRPECALPWQQVIAELQRQVQSQGGGSAGGGSGGGGSAGGGVKFNKLWLLVAALTAVIIILLLI